MDIDQCLVKEACYKKMEMNEMGGLWVYLRSMKCGIREALIDCHALESDVVLSMSRIKARQI